MKKGHKVGVVFSNGAARARAALLTLAISAALSIAATAAEPQYSVVGTFSGPSFSGASANDLSQGPDGGIYGTTYGGGASHEGTLFKLEAAGPVVLASFSGAGGNPSGPLGALCLGTDGAFYGTTGAGGVGGGTLFKYESQGISLLYSFWSNAGDGATPMAGLVQGSDGAFYGTTTRGGDYDQGTFFKYGSNGLLVLHSFSGVSGGLADGADPLAPVLQGADGVFYGTTYGGGQGSGTVFQWSTNGYQTLHAFTGMEGDGAQPFAGLVKGADSACYGVTYAGGSNGLGTIFKLTATGLSTVYSFAGPEGAHPLGALALGRDGALYGTASGGGSAGLGTLFKFDGTTLSALHHFTGEIDGARPNSDLLRATDGSIYGATARGGSDDLGVIFKLTFADGSLPTITCSSEQILTCSPSTGMAAVVSGQVSSAESEPLVVTWNIDPTVITIPAGSPRTEATVSFTSTFLPGTNVVVLTVSNAAGAARCQTLVRVEEGGGTPVLGDIPEAGPFILNSGTHAVGPIEVTAPCGLDLAGSVLTGTVDTSTIGAKTVEFVAVDLGGNRATKTGTYLVQYAPKGMLYSQPTRQVLMPVRPDGSSVFQPGRTVPLRFRVADAQGHSIGTPGLVTNFLLADIRTPSGHTVVLNETPTSTSHNTAFRWDGQRWFFNLKTKAFPSGTICVYRIFLNDGTTINFQFQVK